MICGSRAAAWRACRCRSRRPGFDSAPYLTATLCITRDPDTGIQNMGTYRAALKATDRLVVRMVAREASGAGGYLHWLKYRERREPMPIAIVIGCAPVVMFTGPQKLAIDLDELGVAGALAGAPIEMAKAAHHRPRRAGDVGDRDRGADRSRRGSSPRRRSARATATSRSRPTTCRCRSPRSPTSARRCSPRSSAR